MVMIEEPKLTLESPTIFFFMSNCIDTTSLGKCKLKFLYLVPLYHWLFNVFDFYSEELYILLLPSAHFWNVKKGTREVKTIRNYDFRLSSWWCTSRGKISPLSAIMPHFSWYLLLGFPCNLPPFNHYLWLHIAQ